MAKHYPSSAEVLVYDTWATVPDAVVGTDPFEPPDETYVEYWTELTGTGGEQQFGVAHFDPIPITGVGPWRWEIRVSGYLEGGGDQVGCGLAFFDPADYLSSDWGDALDNTNANTAFDTDWGDPDTIADRDHLEGEIVTLIHYPQPAALAKIATDGIVVHCSSWGAGATGPTSRIGMRVHELVFVTPQTKVYPCRRHPRADGYGLGPTRHYPPPESRRKAGGYK